MEKRCVIVGATSGIGLEVARILHSKGWSIGVAGRRKDRLDAISQELGERVFCQVLDVNSDDAISFLDLLIDSLGGMDLYFHSSGIGYYNPQMDEDREISTTITNCVGFTRMLSHVFSYFRERGNGHIAVISSVAATRALGAAPSYSSSKRYQRTYLESLRQLSSMHSADITITEIRPGFVRTDLLKGEAYPLLLEPSDVAEKIVGGIEKRKRLMIIDWKFRILVFFWELLPQRLWERLSIIRM